MLRIHHLANSQSERVVWLCEELGLDYDVVRYSREPSFAAPPAYKALHPAGSAPTITDGAICLAESGAVFEYIMAKYGNGRLVVGKDNPEFSDYLFWYHFANGTMTPAVLTGIVLQSLGVVQGNALSEGVIGRARHGYALLEARLQTTPYLAGERFTAADIMNLFALTTMNLFARVDLTPFPKLCAYIERLKQRPAYGRAMARAEPGFNDQA